MTWEEESLRECAALLYNVVLQDNIQVRWRWLLEPIHGYSVSGAYHFLTTSDTHLPIGVVHDVWHKQVPTKVPLFACAYFRIEYQLDRIWCVNMSYNLLTMYV